MTYAENMTNRHQSLLAINQRNSIQFRNYHFQPQTGTPGEHD